MRKNAEMDNCIKSLREVSRTSEDIRAGFAIWQNASYVKRFLYDFLNSYKDFKSFLDFFMKVSIHIWRHQNVIQPFNFSKA